MVKYRYFHLIPSRIFYFLCTLYSFISLSWCSRVKSQQHNESQNRIKCSDNHNLGRYWFPFSEIVCRMSISSHLWFWPKGFLRILSIFGNAMHLRDGIHLGISWDLTWDPNIGLKYLADIGLGKKVSSSSFMFLIKKPCNGGCVCVTMFSFSDLHAGSFFPESN